MIPFFCPVLPIYTPLLIAYTDYQTYYNHTTMENLTDKSSEIIKAALTKAEEQSNSQGKSSPPLLSGTCS
jgi:hypothetical protein